MTERARIILASGSRNRQEGMRKTGIPFSVIPSTVDERSIIEQDPILRVEQIARLKARSVASLHKGFIIAADTINYMAGKILEKPVDLEEARLMLETMSGQLGHSYTGICILDTERARELVSHKVTTISCRELRDDEIAEYIASRPVTEWAGVYNPLDTMSQSIFKPLGGYRYGLEYGLPVDILAEELSQVGIDVDLSRFQEIDPK